MGGGKGVDPYPGKSEATIVFLGMLVLRSFLSPEKQLDPLYN